jgi:hypothetical protein
MNWLQRKTVGNKDTEKDSAVQTYRKEAYEMTQSKMVKPVTGSHHEEKKELARN